MTTKSKLIVWPSSVVREMAEHLCEALRIANVVERHASQSDGAYGCIHQAIYRLLKEEFPDPVAAYYAHTGANWGGNETRLTDLESMIQYVLERNNDEYLGN
jgi:hypothetical protein